MIHVFSWSRSALDQSTVIADLFSGQFSKSVKDLCHDLINKVVSSPSIGLAILGMRLLYSNQKTQVDAKEGHVSGGVSSGLSEFLLSMFELELGIDEYRKL
jgi:hypothetical protein